MKSLGLRAEEVLLGVRADHLRDVLEAAAGPLSERVGISRGRVRDALKEIEDETHFAIGDGIAVPHVALEGISMRAVCLVRTDAPLALGAPDGVPVDLFFVVLYPGGDPVGHLQFLARLAAMCRSGVLLEGLRRARTADDIMALVQPAEARLGTVPGEAGEAARALALISVSGEHAADRLMVGLLRREFGSATIVDAQTVQDVASREVPLFAAFRDLFGDPGGRRLILVAIDANQTEMLARMVREACEDERRASAELMVLPISHHWRWEPEVAPKSGGH